MGAAMIGGTAYAAHKAGERSAMATQQEADQEAQQPAAPPPPPAAAPPPAAGGGTDIATQLQSLAQLRDQGVLSPEEFEAAKQKLLAV
jgi:Short C-terminal domain